MRRFTLTAVLIAVALLVVGCGGGSSSTTAGTTGAGGSTTSAGGGEAGGGKPKATGPEQVWLKEIEGVMRGFENSSAKSVEQIHTSSSQYLLEPTYSRYSDELERLGRQLQATKPPPSCQKVYERMGVLAHKVSNLMGVLGHQPQLSPEEFTALAYQQTEKFGQVGRRLTNLTINPHC